MLTQVKRVLPHSARVWRLCLRLSVALQTQYDDMTAMFAEIRSLVPPEVSHARMRGRFVAFACLLCEFDVADVHVR